MEYLDFIKSRVLNNIPAKKLDGILDCIKEGSDTQEAKNIKTIAINRYAESNIPIEYWNINMEKNFVGDPRLKEKYNEYVSDIKESFVTGKSICFAGNHGVGKSMTASCILKKCVLKGYSCCYTTLSDVIAILTQAPNEEKFIVKRELVLTDFIVIDEIDPRFVATESASDLFARGLEGILRTRSQNRLPIIMCTNSPNIVESFNGQLKASLNSLFSGYMEMFPVFGSDHRKKDGAK